MVIMQSPNDGIVREDGAVETKRGTGPECCVGDAQ